MPDPMIKCPNHKCKQDLPYHTVSCHHCGQCIGYPNRRKAESESQALKDRYNEAVRGCLERGLNAQLDALENLAKKARLVINMGYQACVDILGVGKYNNFFEREGGEKCGTVLTPEVMRRLDVGERLFPEYHQHLIHAAVSPDGLGLEHYGQVAVCWDTGSDYLEKRLSLLEEHSYQFYDRYHLEDSENEPPVGHMAIWQHRKQLVVAKLGPNLNSETQSEHLPECILQKGESKDEDKFVEAFIYADEGIGRKYVNRVSIQTEPQEGDEKHVREISKACCDVNHGQEIEFKRYGEL